MRSALAGLAVCKQKLRFPSPNDVRLALHGAVLPCLKSCRKPNQASLLLAPGFQDRMSAQMEMPRKFYAMGNLLMMAVLLFATTTSLGCPLCNDLDQPDSKHADLHTQDHNSSVPACDKDACSCCGFHFVASIQVLKLDLIGSVPVREISQLSLLPGTISQPYRPPRV
jgi:hypothetical protein